MDVIFMLTMRDVRTANHAAEQKQTKTPVGMDGFRVLQRLCAPISKTGEGYGTNRAKTREKHLKDIVDALRKHGEEWDFVIPLTNAPEILRDIFHVTGRFPYDRLEARRELMDGLSGFGELESRYLLENGLLRRETDKTKRVGDAIAALAVLQDEELSGRYSLILFGRQPVFFFHELDLLFRLESGGKLRSSWPKTMNKLLGRFYKQGWDNYVISEARMHYAYMLNHGLPAYLVNVKNHYDEEAQCLANIARPI
jgi:hypothetical protein